MRSLKLFFESEELTEVKFQEDSQSEPRQMVRGKTGGAMRFAGSFQWTSAVRAFCVLMAKAAMSPQSAVIQGSAGSLAASLDYALSKQPAWLSDMFGCDAQGTSLARRLLVRTNPERKRPGPVVLGLNHFYLSAQSIEVYIDGSLASPLQLTQLVSQLSNEALAKGVDAGVASDTPGTKLAGNQ